MARNRNNVPKKQWNKWSKKAKAVFNRVYSEMYDATIFLDHKTPNKKQWRITRWNVAWISANAVDQTD